MTAGHVCFDMIPKFANTGSIQIQDVLTPGKLINVGDCQMTTGGSVANTGIAFKKLGGKVCFCAQIGDDTIGNLTSDFLSKNGSIESIKTVKNQSSSYSIVLAPPNIDRIFVHNPGTNNFFSPDDLNTDLIQQCKHFHFGYPPLMQNMYRNDGHELKRVFQIAKAAGAITSCDMSLPDQMSESGEAPWHKILENILPHIDIFLPSVDEIFFMLEQDDYLKMKEEKQDAELIEFLTVDDYSRLAGKILAMGTKMTSLKAGYRGFYFKTGTKKILNSFFENSPHNIDRWANRELWCPAFELLQTASATGSGDSSIAGFLSAFMHGYSLEMCLKYACIAGWQNIQVLDAVSGIKSWEETTRILNSQLPIIQFEFDNPDWSWVKESQIWAGKNDQLNQK